MKLKPKRVTSDFIQKLAQKSGIDISKYDMDQLMMGYVVELEHDTNDTDTDVVQKVVDPLKIAIAHLEELPDYYDRLKNIEEVIRQEVRSMMAWQY